MNFVLEFHVSAREGLTVHASAAALAAIGAIVLLAGAVFFANWLVMCRRRRLEIHNTGRNLRRWV